MASAQNRLTSAATAPPRQLAGQPAWNMLTTLQVANNNGRRRRSLGVHKGG